MTQLITVFPLIESSMIGASRSLKFRKSGQYPSRPARYRVPVNENCSSTIRFVDIDEEIQKTFTDLYKVRSFRSYASKYASKYATLPSPGFLFKEKRYD